MAIEDFDGHQAYGRKLDDISRDYTSLKNFEYTSYTISDLNPGEIFVLHEPIYLARSVITDTLFIPDISKDYKITDIVLAIPITMTLSVRDFQTIDHVIEVIAFEAVSFDDFQSKVTSYLSNLKSKRNEERFRFFGSENKRTIVAEFIIPQGIQEMHGRKKIYSDPDFSNLFYVTY